MNPAFRSLAAHLHSTALAAESHFREKLGATKFKREAIVHEKLRYRPTLSASLKDHYVLCVEVSENAYSNSIDSFVLDCQNHSFPGKMYVVVPGGSNDADFRVGLRRARENGVGVVEIDDNGTAHVFHEAVVLSLSGLRRTELSACPPRWREAVSVAEATFLGGNPPKGCSGIYDEIEYVSRAFANKTFDAGWWRTPPFGEKRKSKDLSKDPWAHVLEDTQWLVELHRTGCEKVTQVLLSQTRGLTQHRNDTGHKPKTIEQLRKRDSQLRTRYETARDLLLEWLDAVKPLRIKPESG